MSVAPGSANRPVSQSVALVNFPAVAEVVEVNAAEAHIEFVKHPEITSSQLEFGAAVKSFVRETCQPCAHFIHLALDGVTNGRREGIKCSGECRRANLARGGHGLFGLARGVLPRRNFGSRLREFGF